MAYTIEQYNALKDSIAQGITRIQYGDKLIEYRSLQEMRDILASMERELGLGSQPRRKYPTFSKGLK